MAPVMASSAWFWASTFVLAVLLYWPVHRLIWVLRVRRLEANTGQKATADAIAALRFSARVTAVVIAVVFAFVFNHFTSRF